MRPPATPWRAVEKFHEATLLGMLASGYFALAGSLDWPAAALMLAALTARSLSAAGILHFELRHKPALTLVIAALIFYPIDQALVSKSLFAASLHLACFLAAVWILFATTPRDFLWLRLIAVLEILAAALLSASPSFLAFLALFILCAIAAYSSSEVLRQLNPSPETPQRSVARATVRSVPRRLAVFSASLFAGILLMTAGMFFVLPRTARAAIERFAPSRYHIPGFSTQITLGEIGEIKQRGTPVMHVRPFGETALPLMRWRGAALVRFDGRTWSNPPTEDTPLRIERGLMTFPEATSPHLGRRLQYQVQLGEIASDTLFFGGTPLTVSINVPTLRRSAGGAVRVPRATVTGLRYGVYAVLESEPAPSAALNTLSGLERRELLTLPPLDRRIYRLARDMVTGATTQMEEAQFLERRLKHDYAYTLDLPSSPPPDPMAHFLFERRKGHCEYFASAMAIMLRAVGIPSRVATGFLYGAYNPLTGWQVIRTSDAHSWVEAWIEGRGWTTFDPTPPDPNASPDGTLSGVALLIDAVGQFWQDWVISYDIERQLVLASRIERSGRGMRIDWFDGIGVRLERWTKAAGVYAAWLAIPAALGIAVLMYWGSIRAAVGRRLRLRRVQRGEAQSSDATLLYERMLGVLERRGFRKPPWVTPLEFAGMLPASETSRLVDRMTAAYNECRFGGRPAAASQMLALLDQIDRA